MTYPNEGDNDPMSAAEASVLMRRLIHLRSDGPGDYENAMRDIAREYGIGFWTQDHLRKKKAKTCDVSLFSRIKYAYADYCRKKAGMLLEQAKIAEAMGTGDDVADIQRELEAIMDRLEIATTKAKGRAK